MLFIHAWSGCDKMSAIINQSKAALMKLVAKGDCGALVIRSTFDRATPDDFGKACVKLFITTCGMCSKSFIFSPLLSGFYRKVLSVETSLF